MESKPLLSVPYIRTLIVLIMLSAVVALGAYTNYTLKQAKYFYMGPTSISVSGEGEVMAKPDIGQFSFSVRAEGKDAKTAQELSAVSINQIMDYLKEAGVEESDIKTTNYYLNPKYRYEEVVCASGMWCPPGNPVVDGYEVSQSIEVKVRDLDQSGALISGVGENGATDISGLSFTIDDDSVLKSEARAKAIENAKVNAEKLAKDLGVDLGRMTSFYEEGDNYPMPYYGIGGDAVMMKAESSIASVPTGENKFTAKVTLTFEVK